MGSRNPASTRLRKIVLGLFLSLLVVGSLPTGSILLGGCHNDWAEPKEIVFGVGPGPAPLDWTGRRGDLAALPSYDPSSTDPFQVDLRGYDLSGLDVTGRILDLLMADFDEKTVWPANLPDAFDPNLIMELGKSPGLGLRELHARGITGQGVSVAIFDQPLLVDHTEYAGNLRHYEERGHTSQVAHGPAVASIAVGKTVGVAPGASLYYIAATESSMSGLASDAIERFLAMNRFLEPKDRLRAISVCAGPQPSSLLTRLVTQAAAQGILVICCGQSWGHGVPIRYHGLERGPLADPELYGNYGPVTGWGFFPVNMSPEPPKTVLLVPMNSRSVASPTGSDEYVFYRFGGWNWCAPYIAGLYALGCQVDPDLDPRTFYDTAMATGRPYDVSALEPGATAVIVDPAALIEALGGPATGDGEGRPVYARMKVALYSANAPEELRDVGEVEAGQEVTVSATEGEWTLVEAGDVQGWLPGWYLSEAKEHLIAGIEPYFMFTKGSADLCLTPEASSRPLLAVGPGRIVEVKAVSGDWAYVSIRVYSIPDVSRGWVLTSALASRLEVKPTEADLLTGTRVYYNDFSAPPAGSATSEVTTYDRWVTIREETGEWTLVSSAGGWDAWVKSADLSYPETGPGK